LNRKKLVSHSSNDGRTNSDKEIPPRSMRPFMLATLYVLVRMSQGPLRGRKAGLSSECAAFVIILRDGAILRAVARTS